MATMSRSPDTMSLTGHVILATVWFAGFMNCINTDLDQTESVPTKGSLKVNDLWQHEDRQIFQIKAFGQNFTLDLRSDDSFMAHALNVQRVKARQPPRALNGSGHDRVLQDVLPEPGDSERDLRGCFYTGTVNQDEDSLVSVSLCRGIRGTFVTRGQQYVIEPVGARAGGAWRARGSLAQLHVVKTRLSSRKSVAQGADHDYFYVKRGDHVEGYEEKEQKRERRFVSAARYIETLVVADASMTRFYGDDIKHYLLTIMGMAAKLFGHPSIKNAVSLVVVKMLVVEDEDVGPEVSRNGGMALRNFCTWQQAFNPASPRHPGHYDTAILFTRKDICGYTHCDTLGVADVGTMCDPQRSCSVIEDNGLQAAFTVSHELGHVLSMLHDDPKTCEKLPGDIDGHHLMAPFIVHLNMTLPWSPCSAHFITEFFTNGHGDCLLNMPDQTIPLRTEPLGYLFGLDHQCQQVFGEEFAHCPNVPEDQACIQLWCREEGNLQCTTRNGSLPWADGTPCGEDLICLEGASQWWLGAWGPWGPCSRTCGGGVEFSHRECINPVPRNGGSYCLGQRVKYQFCNIHTCPENHGKSFREEQCEKYNSDRYLNVQGKIKQWIPKYAGVSHSDRCKLLCREKHSNEFKVFEAKVVDGTTCGPDTTSICVQGQCIKAGCDQVIGSNLRLDKCGVCGGDGASCRKISGTLNKANFGYNDIISIPAGATNIDIKQRSHHGIKHDGNYLAVKSEDETYILNGNFSVSTAEHFIPVRGAILRYSGSSTTLERLLSFKVLQQNITIQLLSTAGDTLPPRVKYSFYMPHDLPFSKPNTKRNLSSHVILPSEGTKWVLGEWSKCSKSCGAGWSRRSVECQDRTGAPSFSCDTELRPIDIRPCGDLPCPVWQLGQWSACSRTCGVGERQRNVLCKDYAGKTVDPEKCNPEKRPEAVSAECFYQDC